MVQFDEVFKFNYSLKITRQIQFWFFSYGVERFYGNFQMAKWEFNNTKYFSNVTVDTFDMPKLLFHTPLDQSFTCPMWGNTYLLSQLHYRPAPAQPTNLLNSTVTSTILRFDAFRDEDFPYPGFRVWFSIVFWSKIFWWILTFTDCNGLLVWAQWYCADRCWHRFGCLDRCCSGCLYCWTKKTTSERIPKCLNYTPFKISA